MRNSETGWVIERADSEPSSPLYLDKVWSGGGFLWSPNHLDAIRFARKEDAEKISTGVNVRICEHAWN